MRHLGLILFAALSYSFSATAAETWTFSSKYDRFTIEYTGGNFLYNGEAVNGSWAEELRPVLESEMNIECEGLPKKADLRLKWERNGKVVRRNFYLAQKMASDGKNCLELTGPGVYYAPFHKSWFVGSKKLTIGLSRGFEIGDEINTWAKFKNEKGKLVSATAGKAVNWETLANLRTVLKDFELSGRAHPDIFTDPERNLTARNVILKAHGKIFKFRQVKGGTWLLQMPKVPWLVLSPKFGFFDSMSASSWTSQHSGELGVVLNSEAKTEDRINAVKSLKSKSSKDVFSVFHQVLLDPNQNEDVKSEIVRTLRFYPSGKNMKVLAKSLEQTNSPELIYETIRVLKLRNPKGPQIDTNAEDSEIQKAVKIWVKWSKSLK